MNSFLEVLSFAIFCVFVWYITVPVYRKSHEGRTFWQDLKERIKLTFGR